RRRAAAPRHRARHPPPAADRGPRRGHQRRRLRDRVAHPAGHRGAERRPHRLHHRPQAVDRRGRAPHPRGGPGGRGREGHARRAAGPGRQVCAAVGDADACQV
ncbi:hypothetical protein E4U41_000341, partial [Claviceps citrina]